jgi:hypothetical protein
MKTIIDLGVLTLALWIEYFGSTISNVQGAMKVANTRPIHSSISFAPNQNVNFKPSRHIVKQRQD